MSTTPSTKPSAAPTPPPAPTADENTTLSWVPHDEVERVLEAIREPIPRARAFATLARVNALYTIMRAGSGHVGTSFSCMDLLSWILLNEVGSGAGAARERRGIYFSSKGHDAPALYAALVGLGEIPEEQLHRLRRLGGLPGHPDVGTPGMVTNTGSLGMGVSKAKGMILANRLLGKGVPVIVLTGDGELQEGQFWESLPSAVHHRMGELTVVIDHNKLQSDTYLARVNDLGDLTGKLAAYGWYVARCDGHDLEAIARVWGEFRAIGDRPKVLVADTVKGHPISFMDPTRAKDDWLYDYHSGAPSPSDYQAALGELLAVARTVLDAAGAGPLRLERAEIPPRRAPERPQQLIRAYADALLDWGARDPRIVVLDGDLAKDCGLLPVRARFPERFVEAGIAEQDMVSMAGGMALMGVLPVVHSFACFLSTRPNEQIYNNATERTKIVYVGSLAGVVPGGPGHSHQSVRDISALGAMPGMTLLEPSTEAEVGMAVAWCLGDTDESSYLRLISVPIPVPYELPPDYRLTFGRGVRLSHGEDAIVFAYGPVMLTQAYGAAELLRERGIGLAVVNLPWLNRVDSTWLAEAVRGYPWVFALDDHYITGGQGDLILGELAASGFEGRARKLGLTDIPHCGTNDEVLAAHGLDADSLAREVARCLGRADAAPVDSPSTEAGRGRRAVAAGLDLSA